VDDCALVTGIRGDSDELMTPFFGSPSCKLSASRRLMHDEMGCRSLAVFSGALVKPGQAGRQRFRDALLGLRQPVTFLLLNTIGETEAQFLDW
jgi:hypothetical protein